MLHSMRKTQRILHLADPERPSSIEPINIKVNNTDVLNGNIFSTHTSFGVFSLNFLFFSIKYPAKQGEEKQKRARDNPGTSKLKL